MTRQYSGTEMNGGRARPCGNALRHLALLFGLCLFLAANLAPAQVAEPKTWPDPGRGLWYWIEPKTDLAPEQIAAAFERALEEEMAFMDPAFGSTVFLAKKIRLCAGKAKARKKYPERPEKADDIRLEAEWRTGHMNQYRGTGYRFITLDSLRGMDLHYLPDLQRRFPKAPAGGNWNVNLYAAAPYNLFFRTEDTARNFINAVASTLKQRELGIRFSRFGLMWENVTPAQAAEMGRPTGQGVLVTMVAIAGPADRAGIRPLDVALEVDGIQVKNVSHFSLLLDELAPGTGASLLLLRRLKSYAQADAWNPLTLKMEAR